MKLKNDVQSSMTLILVDVDDFVKNRVTNHTRRQPAFAITVLCPQRSA